MAISSPGLIPKQQDNTMQILNFAVGQKRYSEQQAFAKKQYDDALAAANSSAQAAQQAATAKAEQATLTSQWDYMNENPVAIMQTQNAFDTWEGIGRQLGKIPEGLTREDVLNTAKLTEQDLFNAKVGNEEFGRLKESMRGSLVSEKLGQDTLDQTILDEDRKFNLDLLEFQAKQQNLIATKVPANEQTRMNAILRAHSEAANIKDDKKRGKAIDALHTQYDEYNRIAQANGLGIIDYSGSTTNPWFPFGIGSTNDSAAVLKPAGDVLDKPLTEKDILPARRKSLETIAQQLSPSTGEPTRAAQEAELELAKYQIPVTRRIETADPTESNQMFFANRN